MADHLGVDDAAAGGDLLDSVDELGDLADPGSTRATFEDFAILMPQAAPILGIGPDEVAAVVGTIDGRRALAILRAYTNAYFDTYLRHRDSHLLNGPSARYPEVRFTDVGRQVGTG